MKNILLLFVFVFLNLISCKNKDSNNILASIENSVFDFSSCQPIQYLLRCAEGNKNIGSLKVNVVNEDIVLHYFIDDSYKIEGIDVFVGDLKRLKALKENQEKLPFAITPDHQSSFYELKLPLQEWKIDQNGCFFVATFVNVLCLKTNKVKVATVDSKILDGLDSNDYFMYCKRDCIVYQSDDD